MEPSNVPMEHAGLRIAVEGCGHGELDKIYETVQYMEQRDGKKVDLVLCCGDFQAVRNKDDLECMACPPKYRDLATFYKYYSGEKAAPYPTIFIGGNHEASNYLWELYHGGWVAPNIYFLGYAGVVQFGGLRIAGLSGIFKFQHYTMGHFERPPYSESAMRSAYHVRTVDVNRLLRLSGSHIDVFLSHDWPAGIARHGDVNALLRKKRFLQREIDDGSLGSPPAAQILEKVRPEYWFSAHLHTKFAALVHHPSDYSIHQRPGNGGGGSTSNAPASVNEASMTNPQEAEESQAVPATTRFLSLDKCLPGRQFLQIIDFPKATGPKTISYDPEWLAILKSTHHLTSLHPRPPPPPPPERVTQAQIAEIQALLGNNQTIPLNFQPTAPAYSVLVDGKRPGKMPQIAVRNPQTVTLFELLGVEYNLDHSGGAGIGIGGGGGGGGVPAAAALAAVNNPEEIEIDNDDDNTITDEVMANPEEIDLGDGDDDEDEDGEGVDPALTAVLSAAT
ncbi:putative Lariat debranching enzyme [Nannochloris sp. 'desiccata']|nr:putative Lariat debranching enzyme [Chlorella desiccata (nom. nud.)]